MNNKLTSAHQERLELVSYPHRGIFRLADRWGVTLAAWAFGCGAGVMALHAALELQKTQAAWLIVGWLMAILALGIVRGMFLTLRENHRDVDEWYHDLQWRGGQTFVAFGSAVVLVVIIKTYDLSAQLALYVWPTFLPGIITMTQRFTHMNLKRRRFVSRLSQYVIIYMAVSAGMMIWLANDPRAWIPIYPQTGISGVLGMVLWDVMVYIPAFWTVSSQLLLYYLMRRGHLSRVLGNLLARIFETLVQMDEDLQKSWDKVAELIQELLHYHRVIILAPDAYYRDIVAARSEEERQDLYKQAKFQVLGRAGMGAEKMSVLEFPLIQGVAFRCLREGKCQRVDDVQQIPYYFEAGLSDTI